MNATRKIRKFGNFAGVILPKEMLAHLDIEVGQTASVTKRLHGIEMSAPDTDFEA